MDWILGVGIGLLILGFILVAVEMIVPGFGVPGIAGIISLVLGIICVSDGLVEGIFITLIVLAIVGLIAVVILWLFAKGKLSSPLILEEEQKKEQGYISSSDLQYLLGRQGEAVTDLRPAGAGDFDGVRFDVLSEAEYIQKGTRIEIIKVSGSKLFVKRID